MNLKFDVLSSKKISHRSWYLCRANLLDYLNSLKPEFYDFAIQRRIVKNQYLDILYETIVSGDPIPMITLTSKKDVKETLTNGTGDIEIEMNDVEILDGLQRTFRLWAYKTVSEIYNSDKSINPTDLAKKIKNAFPLFFDSGVISTSLVRELISKNRISGVTETYKNFDTYFIIWSGLNEKEVIKKMLVLNAGQKAVSKTHQFELLFLHYYDEIIKTQKQIKLVKEKDSNSSDVKKGSRDIGQFMFSSIIVSLQSFVEKKPLRISTEGLFNELEPEVETEQSVYDLVFSSEFIKLYLKELYNLDTVVSEKEKDQGGKEWFVKDTTLSGVFAAVGKKININNSWSGEELEKQATEGFTELKNAIKAKGFNLKEFTIQYNNNLSRSVNIGNYIRKVVMEYTSELLEGKTPNWSAIFEQAKKGGVKS